MPDKRPLTLARTWLYRCAMDARVSLLPGGKDGLTELANALLELEQRQVDLAAAFLELDRQLSNPLSSHLRDRLRSIGHVE